MKHLKLFVTILFAMTAGMVQAMDYPDMISEHPRTVSEPWQEFKLRLTALKGWDNFLYSHQFYIGQRYGLYIPNATSFSYGSFNYRKDDDFDGSNNMNTVYTRSATPHYKNCLP